MTKHYFDYFPKVEYDLGRSGQLQLSVDITRRFELTQLVQGRAIVFVEYFNGSGDRPDVIAEKYYNDPNLDWLVLITNDVFDPDFEWAMDHWTLHKHIKAKYGSLDVAAATTHHYEWIIQPETVFKDGSRVAERNVKVDLTTYNTIPDESRRLVTCYQHEKNLNDERKKLKLVHSSYTTQILKEAEVIFNANQ
jgi:hypothetical protein